MKDKEVKKVVEATQELHKEDCRFIPYQKCPLCDGSGRVVAEGIPSGCYDTCSYDTCPVCQGIKIIPMHEIKIG